MPVVNKKLPQPGERIRVLVVDDSVVIRRLVTKALYEDGEIAVGGTAANGSIALHRNAYRSSQASHVLTLDIEMPEMDGLEKFGARLRRDYPQLRRPRSARSPSAVRQLRWEALRLGASDYVTKASTKGRWIALLRAIARRPGSED